MQAPGLVEDRAASPPAARGAGPVVQALAALVLLASTAVTLGAAVGLAHFGAGLRWSWEERYPLALGAAVVCGALALRALLLAVPERGAPARVGAAHVRIGIVVAVATVALHTLLLQPFRVHVALLTLALAGGVYAVLALLLAARRAHPSRVARGVELLLFSAAVSLLSLELGLRVVAAQVPHPLISAPVGDARAFLDAWRLTPGDERFRFPVNSRGDFDHEWTGRAPGQKLVVCIGDSFSTSTAPLPLHFTSIAEDMLENTEVYNMGAPAIGPPEYLLLLSEHALPMEPDLVVVNLFVGNDMRFRGGKELDVPALRAWLDSEDIVLMRLVRRLRAIAAERARQGGERIGVAQGSEARGRHVVTREQAYEAFPFTVDPSLEKPMFSTTEFLKIERGRALVCDTAGPPYKELEAILERMRVTAGERLVVFLIPDEFQIDDELWELVSEAHPNAQLDRFLPQKRVRAWCEANGVDLVDPTEALLAAPPLADGKAHTYHLRDTHWNARGNAIGGEKLGTYLRERLAR